MDKSQAETFISNSLISMNTRKLFNSFMLFCCVIAIICFSIYFDIIYTIFVAIVLSSAIVTDILANCKRFKSEYYKAVFCAIDVLLLCSLLDMLMYGLFEIAGSFVWWAYMILIAFELIAFISTLLINRVIVKRSINKRANAAIASGALTAGISGHCLATSIVCIFRPAANVVMFVLIALICVCVCMFEIAASCQIYRAYLIRHFKLEMYMKIHT